VTTAERNLTAIEEVGHGEGVVLTLANGDEGNYLGLEELDVLTDALDRAQGDGRRWVLLRQRGQDFCLGRAPQVTGAGVREALSGFVQHLQTLEVVTISAVRGASVGFGVGLCSLTDLTIASQDAWFQFPEILHGPAPAIVASWLYDRVPYKQALHWTLTGARFGAEEAHAFGLVSKVVAPGELDEHVDETLQLLDGLSAGAVRNAKSMGRAMSVAPPDPAVRRAMALRWFA
jgi:enoyl-CoA hydratase/carnithine racemase